MAITMANLFRRQHIQDHDSATNVTLHWGYPSRVVPCTNDPGSCEYLDGVYWMHDVSMLYTFILWAVIGGIVLSFIFTRLLKPTATSTPWDRESQKASRQGFVYRVWRSISAFARQWLLPESLVKYFRHTTRLQLLLLAVMLGYLLIFSLVGIVYKTWITPVKNSDKFNTRTGLGGFSDRVGALAYALTPLSVLLSSRESILSLTTGVPYHHFNFLHRWLGRIIFIQSFLHTLGWVIIEAKLYQPQPKVWNTFAPQEYIVWGWVAMGLLILLYVLSIRRVIQWTGYEFFRKVHYVLAGLYFGACWAHWSRLACWMIAALGLFFIDRGLRILRTCLIHFGYKSAGKGFGFHSIPTQVQSFVDPESVVLRLTFSANHDPWATGQHFFLCFPSLSIWQSHPFTPASVPAPHPQIPQHVYIIRAMKGQTAELARLAQSSGASTTKEKTEDGPEGTFETPVIIGGPYGKSILDSTYPHILAIAGGTGISFTLPIATAVVTRASITDSSVHFVWIIRHAQNIAWIAPELAMLKEMLRRGAKGLKISIYITREAASQKTASSTTKAAKQDTKSKDELTTTTDSVALSSSSSDVSTADCCVATSSSLSTSLSSLLAPVPNFEIHSLVDHHPSIPTILSSFIEDTIANASASTPAGPIQVAASGPVGLGADIRAAVAARNDAGKVWKGDWSADVDLYWDDRMI